MGYSGARCDQVCLFLIFSVELIKRLLTTTVDSDLIQRWMNWKPLKLTFQASLLDDRLCEVSTVPWTLSWGQFDWKSKRFLYHLLAKAT